MADPIGKWEARGKTPTLFRRFDFERYAQTRDFMDALSELAQADGVHPQNINFSSTYVNVTLTRLIQVKPIIRSLSELTHFTSPLGIEIWPRTLQP